MQRVPIHSRVMFLQASKQKQNAKKSAASTAKDRLTESVLNKQTEVHHHTCHSLAPTNPWSIAVMMSRPSTRLAG